MTRPVEERTSLPPTHRMAKGAETLGRSTAAPRPTPDSSAGDGAAPHAEIPAAVAGQAPTRDGGTSAHGSGPFLEV
jgi:hypothetical protein